MCGKLALCTRHARAEAHMHLYIQALTQGVDVWVKGHDDTPYKLRNGMSVAPHTISTGPLGPLGPPCVLRTARTTSGG